MWRNKSGYLEDNVPARQAEAALALNDKVLLTLAIEDLKTGFPWSPAD